NLRQSGIGGVTVAGGVASLTAVALGSNVPQCPGNLFPPELLGSSELVPQSMSAELGARKSGIDRKAMDEFSVRSHHLAAEATEKGYLRSQIMPIEITNGTTELMDRDEGIRANASYEAVSQLQPASNPEHSITAGNSSH